MGRNFLYCLRTAGVRVGFVVARAGEGSSVKVVDPIPVELDAGELSRTFMSEVLKEREIASLMDEYRGLVEPRAVFVFVRVAGIEGDEVRLESGHVLKSLVLGDMLECGQTIVPFVVTVGPGLEKQASREAKESILRSWMLERMGDYALGKACDYLVSRVEEWLGSAVSTFSPGEGTGKLFGIEQQEVLFQILDPAKSVDVRLTSGCMMVPRKSVSGVLAATRREYVACQYCPRERCEGRRRPFGGEYYPIKCEGRVE